jgi:hypothetical protein
MAAKFFRAVVEQARAAGLLSDERFTVDGTLIEAWASEKSYVPRIGPRGRRGSGEDGKFQLRDTHVSKTDPEAGMYRKSLKTGWRLQHMAHAVSENRHGLVVATAVSGPSPRAERERALAMLRRLGQRARRYGPWAPTRDITNGTSLKVCVPSGPARMCPPMPKAAAAGSTLTCPIRRSSATARRGANGSNASSPG